MMMLHTIFLLSLGFTAGFQLRPPSTLSPRSPSYRISKKTQISVSTTEAPAAAKQQKSDDDEEFDWNKQWYPALSLKETDPGRAHAVQLLGKDLVVWRNNEGRWSTFDDRCPHRAAPLTEGRVEKDGSLLCAYHAWRFDADGKCLSIPQSDNGGKDEARSAACAKIYPTQVAEDIIWVWGDNGPDAGLESAVTPAPLIPERSDPELKKQWKVTPGAVYQRDLPYSWETFVENVVDPAHVVVSHHGIMGNRDMAAPVHLEMEKGAVSKSGFDVVNNKPDGKDVKRSVTTFMAPSLVRIDTENTDGSMMTLALYNFPTRPGWSRIMSYQMNMVPIGSNGKPKMLINNGPGGLAPHKLPVWLQHVAGHLFMHQDMVFLHHQEKILAAGGYDSQNYAKGVYVPAAADKGVLALKKWLTKYASGGPQWAKGCDPSMPPREHNRDVLFDVYQTHTKDCTACSGALKGVEKGLKAAKTTAVASLAWAILRGARAVSTSASSSGSVLNLVTARAMLPGFAITLASFGALKVLNTLHKSFHVGSYHHQDND